MLSLMIISFFQPVFALEIDEKLTLRFLKVSNSKKTILINRGAEDGLVVGDHAKFFITSGVIARGLVEKVSPSRSIWSLYRVVDNNEIIEGKVLNLKIASPVKITNDPTKSMKDEEVAVASEKMSLTEDSKNSDSSKALAPSDIKELEEMGIKNDEPKSRPNKDSSKKTKESTDVSEFDQSSINISEKNWEIWSSINFNSLSGSYSSYEIDGVKGNSNTESLSSNVELISGIERFFSGSNEFFDSVSINAFIYYKSSKNDVLSPDLKFTSSLLGFGGGARYHFYNLANQPNKIILFGDVSIGSGSASISQGQVVTAISSTQSGTLKNSFFTFGLGAKYFLKNGFGVRVLADYFISNDTFDITYSNSSKSLSAARTLSGPRIQTGFSYRF